MNKHPAFEFASDAVYKTVMAALGAAIHLDYLALPPGSGVSPRIRSGCTQLVNSIFHIKKAVKSGLIY
jgi:hypothetical protein